MMQRPEDHSSLERDEAEVQSWFQALEPPQPFSPSSQFRHKVFADIEQRRDYRGWWTRLTLWYASMEIPPGMRTACATGMILALGVAVLWGVQEFGHHRLDNGRTALDRQGAPEVLWPTYQFQQKLARAAAPGSLVSDDAVLETSHEAYGFAPLPARTLFFRLGTAYAQALALLQSDDRVRAAQHVNHLVEALRQVEAPQELSAYLHAMHAMLQYPQTDGTMLAQVLAAFEPLYTAAYTKVEAEEGLTYFRFGTWVVNVSLAAAVGNRTALRQEADIEALRHALAQHEAAPVVLDTLAQLHALLMQPTLTEHEMHQVQTLVQNLQRLMRD